MSSQSLSWDPYGVSPPSDTRSPNQPNPSNIYISGNARVHVGDNHILGSDNIVLNKQQDLLRSLVFPQMNSRFDQISDAYPATYEWIFHPLTQNSQPWDRFDTWIRDFGTSQGLYWISGKPGSGKSTMMKFIDEKIVTYRLPKPLYNGQTVIRSQHFFWSAGTIFQRSLNGFYRNLLVQILRQCPAMMEYAMQYLQSTNYAEDKNLWSNSELRKALVAVIGALIDTAVMFLIVDGLDECGDHNKEQEELVNFLITVSSFTNVKACIASRRQNLFEDAFISVPQLKLENLTAEDIQKYIKSQLQSCRRWPLLEAQHRGSADELISDIIERAEAVFLWVVLVVRDLLSDIRDGDSIKQLQRKINNIPADLHTYFESIFQSIPYQHRREASILLQLALHEETRYISLFSLNLVDTIFVSESTENFATRPGFELDYLDLKDEQALCAQMDAASRKLSSRCRGLLQCVELSIEDPASLFVPDSIWFTFTEHADHDEYLTTQEMVRTDIPGTKLNVTVGFLHRSLRDFLLLPRIQNMLHSYTDGKPFDSRLYLCNARIVQLKALLSIGYIRSAAGMASHILSTLWVFRDNPITIITATLIRSIIESLAACVVQLKSKSRVLGLVRVWYIDLPLRVWEQQRSNFLSLAIDFQLTSYVLANLTMDTIRQKDGRPLLDYILRPCFAYYIHPGNHWPDLQLTKAALDAGANPNCLIEQDGPSLWSLYLCWLRDYIRLKAKDWHADAKKQQTSVQVLLALIRAGAALYLPLKWMSSIEHFGLDGEVPRPGNATDSYNVRYFTPLCYERWPNLVSEAIRKSNQQLMVVPVSAILIRFIPHFSNPLPLIEIVNELEVKQSNP